MRNLLAKVMRFKLKLKVLVVVFVPLTVIVAHAPQMCQVVQPLIPCASCRIAALVTSIAL